MDPTLRLSQIAAALDALELRRRELLAERAQLLAWEALRPAPPPPQSQPPSPGRRADLDGPVPSRAPVGTSLSRSATGETSPVTVQAVLLALGGLLLSVAAVVFTVVAWGRVGIGGKAVILLGLTGALLAVPVTLARRRLGGSAEAVAAVGLVLTVLDGYAAWATGLAGLDGTAGSRYAAVVAAVLAAGWWGYAGLTGLVGPRVAAVLAGQLALPLLAASVVGPAGVSAAAAASTIAASFAVLAGADVALVAVVRRGTGREAGPVAWVAGLAGGTAWLAAVTVAAAPASGTRLGDVAPAAGVLALAAGVAAVAAAVAPAGASRARAGTNGAGTAGAGTAGAGTAGAGTARVGTARVGTARVGTARAGTARAGTARAGTNGADTAGKVAGGELRNWAAGVATVVAALAAFAVLRLPLPAVLAGAAVAAPVAVLAGWLPSGLSYRLGVWWAAGGLVAGAAAVPVAGALRVVAGALGWTDGVWAGAPAHAVAALSAPDREYLLGIPPRATLPAAALLAAACLAVAARRAALPEVAGAAAPPPASQPGRPPATTTARWDAPPVTATAATAASAAARPNALPAAATGAGAAAQRNALPAASAAAARRNALPATSAAAARPNALPAAATGAGAAAQRNALPAASAAATRRNALPVASAAAATVLTLLAVLLDPPYPVALAGLAVVAALAGVLACRPALAPGLVPAGAAAVPALVLGGTALAWSLAGRTPTIALLAATVAIAAYCATGAGLPGRLAAALAGLAAQALTLAVVQQAYPLLGTGATLAVLAWALPGGRGAALRLAVLPGAAVAVLLGTGHPDVPAAAALLLLLLAAGLPAAAGRAVLAAAAVAAGLAAAQVADPYLAAAGAPLRLLAEPWSRPARFVPLGGTPAGPVLVTMALLGAGATWLGWLLRRTRGATVASLLAAAALAVAVPAAAGWPYLAGLLWLAALALVAATATIRFGAAGPLAAVLAVLADAAGLATEPATVATLGGTVVAAVTVAATARDAAARAGARWAAVLGTGAEAAALAGSAGAAAGSMVAAGLATAGLCLGALALRRPALAYPSGAALLVATWVELGTVGVSVPEAYTGPAAAVALLLGLLRRRRQGSGIGQRREGRTVATSRRARPEEVQGDPGLSPAVESSWPAYGPGLALGLLPSLAATLELPENALRTVLLAATALAVTLAGARWRLRAPLLAGGGTLVVLALYELGPAAWAWVGGLPRWIPIALAGVLLLAVGGTYERRLRDLRRLRESVGRMV